MYYFDKVKSTALLEGFIKNYDNLDGTIGITKRLKVNLYNELSSVIF